VGISLANSTGQVGVVAMLDKEKRKIYDKRKALRKKKIIIMLHFYIYL
jgi:hypothetical protein